MNGKLFFYRNLVEAKQILDRLINKQRVALYKPIQIAEILYRARIGELSINDIRYNLEAYRNPSKRWRDNITRLLIDQISTSSQRFQDNLFEPNAMPPEILSILAEENTKRGGIVERYIYQQFRKKQLRILHLIELLQSATVEEFKLPDFLDEFEHDRGIKRSIDKAYEIIVYALFNTLVQHLRIRVTLSIDSKQLDILSRFEEFATLVLGIDAQKPTVSVDAKLYRAGVTNAADKGLDIWSNFGPVVQVKHVTLTDEIAEDICEEITADHIVIVCNDSERETIERICKQLGQRIQGIITQNQLVKWYDEALHGKFSNILGNSLLNSLRQEFRNEFPHSVTFDTFYNERKYNCIPKSLSSFWIDD